MAVVTMEAAHPPFSSYKHDMPKRDIANWSIRTYGPSPGSHAHDHFQVLWGLEGNLELEVEGKGGPSVFFSPVRHRYFMALPMHMASMPVSPSMADSMPSMHSTLLEHNETGG